MDTRFGRDAHVVETVRLELILVVLLDLPHLQQPLIFAQRFPAASYGDFWCTAGPEGVGLAYPVD
jgi:hypothetical protein